MQIEINTFVHEVLFISFISPFTIDLSISDLLIYVLVHLMFNISNS